MDYSGLKEGISEYLKIGVNLRGFGLSVVMTKVQIKLESTYIVLDRP